MSNSDRIASIRNAYLDTLSRWVEFMNASDGYESDKVEAFLRNVLPIYRVSGVFRYSVLRVSFPYSTVIYPRRKDPRMMTPEKIHREATVSVAYDHETKQCFVVHIQGRCAESMCRLSSSNGKHTLGFATMDFNGATSLNARSSYKRIAFRDDGRDEAYEARDD